MQNQLGTEDQPHGWGLAVAEAISQRVNGMEIRLRLALAASASVGLLAGIHGGVLLLPLAMGRGMMGLLGAPSRGHDMYAFLLGLYLLYAASRACRALCAALSSRDVATALRQGMRRAKLVAQASLLFGAVVGACPLMLGMLLELLLRPMKMPADRSPIVFLYQDWLLGLLCLKLWHRSVTVTPWPEPNRPQGADRPPAAGAADEPAPVANNLQLPVPQQEGGNGVHRQPVQQQDLQQYWQEAFARLHAGGMDEPTLAHAWEGIARPLLLNLSTALALPYALSRALIPALGLLPPQLIPPLQLYAYHFALAAMLLWIGSMRLKGWTVTIHDTIRDQRYLIGQKLNNFKADRAAPEEPEEGEEAQAAVLPEDPTPAVRD
ncbi:uncharacterized protein LOC142355864 [Convolutriloba macropyga]|uniref:uncharacterized protein LOC142355864 n=1 Tax=Convolutriloba macropyga TaxID=536237 RepID=UPI003F5220B2